MKRLGGLAIVCSLLISMGAHLPFIQSVAWVEMAAANAQSVSWQASVRKTLDGRHPCRLCRKVRDASHAEASLGAVRMDNRLDVLPPLAAPRVMKRPIFWSLARTPVLKTTRVISFDSPPPRTKIL